MAEKTETKSVLVKFPDWSLIERVDDWRGDKRPPLNRSEAIRQLLDIALKAEGK